MASSLSSLLCHTLLFSLLTLAAAATKPLRPKAVVLPLSKDATTLQYTTTINLRTPPVPTTLVFDLSGNYLWVDCESGYASSTYVAVPCNTPQCAAVDGNMGCDNCFPAPSSGCNTSSCSVSPINTIAPGGTLGQLGQDVASVSSTDGAGAGAGPSVTDRKTYVACATANLLRGLAAGAKGMVGASRSKAALPKQFASAFGIRPTMSVCLPSSSSAPGAVFFGDGPFVMQPGVDATKNLTFTPLVVNPKGGGSIFSKPKPSNEYYLSVKAIKVSGKNVPINSSLLAIDTDGNGGAKLSTVTTYTTLETSIYKALTAAFVREATGGTVKMTKVAPVPPFGTCFSSTGVASTPAGPAVPGIELVVDGGGAWSVTGANSMVAVKGGTVLCLGFVDGGLSSGASVVIGSRQMEDNMVQVDLEKNLLGFSSSLLGRKTSCSNFNFKPAA